MIYKEFIDYLQNKSIKGFLFDVDGTLTQTNRYYKERLSDISKLLAKKLKVEEKPEVFAERIMDLGQQIYEKRNRKPELVGERYIDAIELYLNNRLNKDIKDYINSLLDDFYLHSPIPYDSAIDLLRDLVEAKIPISLHSHAQYDWTKIKAEALSKLIDCKLPFLATDIFQSKDKESWIKAFKVSNFKPEHTFVMGDNFQSDILPVAQTGCKNFVWIDRRNERGKENVLDDDINIIIVEKIEDLKRMIL